jgi:hypothetical protein
MMRNWMLAMAAGLIVALPVTAQEAKPLHFQWQTGQEITYRVEQVTTASEVAEGKTTETNSTVHHVKRWKVLEVGEAGVATLQLTLLALHFETTSPKGDILLFDSEHPEKSTPQLREQMSKYVGNPLAVLRVNPQGKVVEVKEGKFGPAGKYDTEPPFVLILSEAGLKSWERTYFVTLDPPQGTGEKFETVQKYALRTMDEQKATISLTTAFKAAPEAPADRVPLLPLQPSGEVVFDCQSGQLMSARLEIDQEIKDHQGEGSSYRFRSRYTETILK